MDDLLYFVKIVSILLGMVLGTLYCWYFFRQRRELHYLYFALIAFCAVMQFAFYREEYFDKMAQGGAQAALLFNVISWAILPWFIDEYAGGKITWPKIALSILLSGWIFIALNAKDLGSNRPLHLAASFHLLNSCNILYGFLASIWLFNAHQRKKARTLLLCMGCLSLLFLHAILSNYSTHYQFRFNSHYFPLGFFPVIFMVVMATEMTAAVFKQTP